MPTFIPYGGTTVYINDPHLQLRLAHERREDLRRLAGETRLRREARRRRKGG